VDDVDRVDSPLVPKLLMGLHDLFDELGRCAFVVALDPAVVSGGLSQINPAWSSAPAFLEKIVQYPFRLPRPTQEQMQRFVVEALNESRLNLPQQAVLDVLDLLPPNPRLGGQLKTDNFWTGKTDNFPRPRLVSSTSMCPPSASPCGLSSASFSVRI
jgi:hypothetical protein